MASADEQYKKSVVSSQIDGFTETGGDRSLRVPLVDRRAGPDIALSV
jgi:hypothetical protein